MFLAVGCGPCQPMLSSTSTILSGAGKVPTQARLILQTLSAVRQSIRHTEREPSKSAVQPALAPVARAAEPLRILDCERASEGLWPEATR